jgi:hypothetical protein
VRIIGAVAAAAMSCVDELVGLIEEVKATTLACLLCTSLVSNACRWLFRVWVQGLLHDLLMSEPHLHDNKPCRSKGRRRSFYDV